ncbi:MAG: permease prefix domain 1-containing protein [Planctomycetaceae bacterium]
MSARGQEALHRWLDDASAAMAGTSEQRHDMVLELESTIQDRVEERTRHGQESEQAIAIVLKGMGDPAQIGSAYAPGRPLLALHHTRPFLLNTASLFAAHFLLVLGATVADRELVLGVLRIAPIDDPKSVLSLCGHALRTLFFDAGLVLVLFTLLSRVGRAFRFPRLELSVRPERRRNLEGAFFLALVLVVVNFFRDDLLALYVRGETGVAQVPLVGPGLVKCVPWLNLWLGLALVRELLYARYRERRWTLAFDLVSCVAGLFCLLLMVAAERLVDLAPAHELLGQAGDGLAALLNTAFGIIALTAAALLAAKAVRRGVRIAILER